MSKVGLPPPSGQPELPPIPQGEPSKKESVQAPIGPAQISQEKAYNAFLNVHPLETEGLSGAKNAQLTETPDLSDHIKKDPPSSSKKIDDVSQESLNLDPDMDALLASLNEDFASIEEATQREQNQEECKKTKDGVENLSRALMNGEPVEISDRRVINDKHQQILLPFDASEEEIKDAKKGGREHYSTIFLSKNQWTWVQKLPERIKLMKMQLMQKEKKDVLGTHPRNDAIKYTYKNLSNTDKLDRIDSKNKLKKEGIYSLDSKILLKELNRIEILINVLKQEKKEAKRKEDKEKEEVIENEIKKLERQHEEIHKQIQKIEINKNSLRQSLESEEKIN